MAFRIYDILLTLRNKKYPLGGVETRRCWLQPPGAMEVQGLPWNKANLFSPLLLVPSDTQRTPA